jgi:hypothetical protein
MASRSTERFSPAKGAKGMLSRYLFAFTLLGLVLAPAPARPADEKTTPPTIQVRLNSLDRTLDDLKFFLSLAGQKEATDQLEGLQKNTLPNGFEGIDTKKPWALYGLLSPNPTDSAGVLLVPVTSEKAFLGLLENAAHLKPTKDGDYYVVQPDNVPFQIYIRFTEGYACAAGPDKGALEKGKLILPSVMFAKPISGSADVHFRIDQIPNEYKQLLLGQVEVQLANAQEQKVPGEDEATHRGRVLGIKTFGQMFSAVVKDGADISVDLDISREHDRFGFGLGLGAKSGTDLAKKFSSLTGGNSLFAGWIKPTSPVNLVFHAPLGEIAQNVVELAFNEGFANLAKQGAQQKVLSEKIQKALAPSIQAKSVDMGFEWRGPSPAGHYTLIAGLKAVDGDKIEGLVKDLVREMPEKDRANIKIDASSIGEFKVHRLDVASTYDKDTRQLLGDNPIYFSFRKDAFFLALGENGLGALGEAMQAPPGASPLARGNLNLKGLVPLMKTEPRADGLAKKSFLKAGDDAISFTAEGGDSLQIRLQAKGAVIKFMAGMGNKK